MTENVFELICGLMFIVSVAGNLNTCPEFAPPKHGHMICDHLLGKYCTPSCNAGYEPERIPAWAYVCNPATKRWATYPESYPLPWPDCVPKGRKISNREHFILNNVFKSKNNDTAKRQLSDILHQSDNDQTKRYNTEKTPPKNPSRDTQKGSNVNKIIEPPSPPSSDLKSVDSKLFQNTSNTLSYQVKEHHENNRTMTSKVDLTNVTSSDFGNQKELDVENVTITTARTNVPKVSGISLENQETEGRVKPHNSVRGEKKQYVQYASQYPNTMESNNITALLNEEVYNATRLGEEAFNNSVMAVWGEYYKNFYKTYARDTYQDNNDTKQKDIVMLADNLQKDVTTTQAASKLENQIAGKSDRPLIDTINKTVDSVTPNSTKPLGVVVVVVDEPRTNNSLTYTANLSTLKSEEKMLGQPSTANSTVINININSININITDSPNDKLDNTLNKLKDLSLVSASVLDDKSVDDISSKSLREKMKKNKDKQVINAEKKKGKNLEQEDDEEDKTQRQNAILKPKITATTQATTRSPSGSETTTKSETTVVNKYDSFIKDAEEESKEKPKPTNLVDVRTFIKKGGEIHEVPNVAAKFVVTKGDPPLVPVFSDKDLSLLRQMVETPINPGTSKRSELKRSFSSLWTKMLTLSSNRDLHSLNMPRLGSKKELAKKDATIAEMIMQDINKKYNYHFTQTQNPFLNAQLQLHEALHHVPKKATDQNPSARQYVWNGATYVPATGDGPLSYLNSNLGGGLSKKSRYRWNGATYVPNEDYQEEEQSHNSDQTTATTTNQSIPSSPYNPLTDSKPFTESSATTDGVQTLPNTVNMKPPEVNPIDADSSVTNLESSTSSPWSATQNLNPLSNTNSNPESIGDGLFFYWDGSKFLQILPDTHLPPEEIIYKKGPRGMEPINLSFNTEKGNSQPSGQTDGFLSENNSDPLLSRWESTTTSVPNNDLLLTKIKGLEHDIAIATTTTPSIVYNMRTSYPQKPPGFSQISETNDRIVAGELMPETTITPYIDETKIPDIFKAPVLYPTQNSEAKAEEQIRNITQKEETTHTPTTSTSTSTITVSFSQASTTPAPTLSAATTVNETYLSLLHSSTISFTTPTTITTSSSHTPSEFQSSTTQNHQNMIIPPPDPTVIHPSPVNITQSNEPHQNNATYPFLPVNSTYQDLKDYTKKLPIMKPDPSNPYKEDSENLEHVIDSDLNLKQAIESLNKIYENASDTTPINIPVTHTGHVSDNRLLPPIFGPFNPTRNPKLENERFDSNNANTTTSNTPISASMPQIPATVVKTNENVNKSNTEQLKIAMQKEEPGLVQAYSNGDLKPSELADALQKSIAETQVSYSKPPNYPSGLEPFKSPEVSTPLNTQSAVPRIQNVSTDEPQLLTNLDDAAKNVLEQTLQSDIDKLESGKIGEDSDNDLLALASVDASGGSSDKDDNTPLSVADIRALLQLTKLAEKESFSKKQGLPYPQQITRVRALRLLRKPGIRRLVRLLVKKRLSPRIIALLKRRKMLEMRQQLLNNLHKRLIDRKRSDALKKLVSIWNKKYQYLRARNSTYSNNIRVNPLPKFGK